jgi:phosphoenolpyruvate---glycerone phosphotransferase subunit DhaL
MAKTIGCSEVCRMLLAAAGKIRQNHEMLSRLDSAVGDGDHGTTLLRTMEAVASTVSDYRGTDLGELLGKVAWAVMGADGGSTGPLLGSFFLGMSEAVEHKSQLDQSAMVAMFESGVRKLAEQSGATVGDKTMMDAVLPALEALKGAEVSRGIGTALRQAAEAAAQGAEETKKFRARFGRARHLGERVIGHADPGAVSVSLLFQSFAEAM